MEELLKQNYALFRTNDELNNADDMYGTFIRRLSGISNGGYQYGTLVGIESPGHIVQISFDASPNTGIRVRQKSSNKWSGWTELSHIIL